MSSALQSRCTNKSTIEQKLHLQPFLKFYLVDGHKKFSKKSCLDSIYLIFLCYITHTHV